MCFKSIYTLEMGGFLKTPTCSEGNGYAGATVTGYMYVDEIKLQSTCSIQVAH